MRLRIYLVEDQAILRESLGAMLELETELEVVGETGDAEQALLELETLDVDVVLMDIRLPGMDGIEATRLLMQRHGAPKVLILTSSHDEYLGAAIEAGATGYCLKSCTRQQLAQAIEAVYQGQASIDQSLTGTLVRELAKLRKVHRASILTPRQLEILKLVANGWHYKEIASALFVNERTVQREIRSVFNRLDVNDAAHAVAEAYKQGII